MIQYARVAKCVCMCVCAYVFLILIVLMNFGAFFLILIDLTINGVLEVVDPLFADLTLLFLAVFFDVRPNILTHTHRINQWSYPN